MGRNKKKVIDAPLDVKLTRGDVVESRLNRNDDHKLPYDSVRFVVKKADTQLKLFNRIKKYTESYKGTAYKPLSFTLYFDHKTDNKVINRQLHIPKIIDKNGKIQNSLLTKEIRKLQQDSDVGGSDVDPNEYEQDYGRLAINFKVGKISAVGNAKGKNVYHPFLVNDLKNYEDGMCGWKCFQLTNFKISKYDWGTKFLRNLKNLTAYIKEENIPIAIVDAQLTIKKLNRPFDVITKKLKLWNLTKEDFENPIFLSKPQKEINPYHYLVYSHKYSHYDICEAIDFKPNILIDEKGVFYEYNAKDQLIPCKNQDAIKTPEDEIEEEDNSPVDYIFLDIETVRDYNNHDINIPYSCSIVVMNNNQLKKLDDIELAYKQNPDKKLYEEKINKIIKNYSHMFYGDKCLDEVYDYIDQNGDNKRFIIYTFNGANFDHYLMYKAALNRENNPVYETPSMAGGQMLEFKYSGKHIFRDIRKYTAGSLKGNCKGYQINLFAKKDGFNHYTVQTEFNKGKEFLDAWVDTNKEKLDEYNTYDTLSLALLYYRVKTALEECVKEFNDEITTKFVGKKILVDNCMTLGMFMNTVFKRHIATSGISLPKFSKTFEENKNLDEKEEMLKFNRDMVSSRIGGRCELFNGDMRVKEQIASLDVCSLYPYVMFCMDNHFPCGVAVECFYYDHLPKNKIGFFYCTVDQQNMNIPFLPVKNADGNDWRGMYIENILLDSISIEYIRANDGIVETRNGYYFDKKEKGIKLFPFLAEIMKKKNEQDILCESQDPSYNPALRSTYKLCLNILSGKLNQDLHTDKLEFMTNEQFNDHVRTKGASHEINTIMQGANKKFLVKYQKPEIESLANCAPIPIGYMIYVYARKYMHEHMYNKCQKEELIYTDTDSNKIKMPEFNKWVENYGSKTIVPHCKEILKYDPRFATHKLYEANSKVFGSFEDEYKDMIITDSFFLQKKFYYVQATKRETGENADKMLCKGMCKDDIVIPIEFDDDVSTEIKEQIRNTGEYDGIKYKRIKDDPKEFYKNLYKNRTSKVLTFSMKKHHGNLKKNTTPEDSDKMNQFYSSISAVYPIKTITIKELTYQSSL